MYVWQSNKLWKIVIVRTKYKINNYTECMCSSVLCLIVLIKLCGILQQSLYCQKATYQYGKGLLWLFFILYTDYKNNLQSLAFVQYSFDRLAHPIRLPPHGNSKGKKPFSRTKPSTIRLIKSAVESKPPRKAFREIENIKGGVMGAAAGCDLPRDRKQVQNLKYSESHSDLLCKPSTDILAHVMQICKDSAESDSVFVRSVEAAPEPMCVLATNQQLKDMERFCTGHPSSVLSIDPTFNLGPFNVTPTTYHHLLVETSRGSNPILLGPILIHQTKTFRPFHYFASTLIRLNPVLANLKAYGTDGEPELIKAFDTCFPRAVHLRCTNHIRQNIKDKLRSLNIPDSVGKDFMADIFGVQVGSHLETGLVDSMSEMSFTKSLQRLKAKWDNLEMSCRAEVPRFYDWFSHYKADEIVKCVLPKVRQQAGQDPSVLFTTNSSESLNHVIKMEVEWKENRLPQLIEKMKSITEDQMSKVESAVVERGEWHFTSQYTDMIIPEIRWFSQMSTNAKKQHLSKVNKLCPFNAHCLASSLPSHTSRLGAANSDQPSTSILSVSVEEAGLTNIAECTLRSMWAKAEKIVSTEGILKVPWSKDPMSRMVKSSTSDQPHLVTRNPKNVDLFCCDKSCPMFKGFSVCSHVIASAHDNGCLRLFLDQLSGVCRPNLTAIANHGMPTGVGRKGGVAKYKRKRKHPVVETRSVRQCISESHLPPAADTSGSCTSSTPSSHSTQPPANPLDFTSLLSTLHPVCSNTTATATSQGQVFVGSSIVNLTQGQVSLPTVPSISTAPRSSSSGFSSMRGQLDVTKKPFVLKFKTPLIKICQSCRKNYDGQNDTLGLVLAREERRLVSNLATGKQFFGRESNSHYHLRMQCIKAVEPSFEAKEMVIPEEVEQRLNNYQRLYLKMCFQLQ